MKNNFNQKNIFGKNLIKQKIDLSPSAIVKEKKLSFLSQVLIAVIGGAIVLFIGLLLN